MKNAGRPNLFLIGAMKAGTSAFYHILRKHRSIFMPSVKEPNYFADDKFKSQYFPMEYSRRIINRNYHNMCINSEHEYLRLFENASFEKYLGDASPSYLPSKYAPRKIATICPNAKILIILRNPIERAYSHYLMDLAIGRTAFSFMDAIESERIGRKSGSDFGYLGTGLYYSQILNYMNTFGYENIHIILYEEFVNDAREVLDGLSEFLAISKFDCNISSQKYNLSKIPRFGLLNRFIQGIGIKFIVRNMMPTSFLEFGKGIYYSQKTNMEEVPESCRNMLREYFIHDVQCTARLINRDLSFWLRG